MGTLLEIAITMLDPFSDWETDESLLLPGRFIQSGSWAF
jgi:hypothetical protein